MPEPSDCSYLFEARHLAAQYHWRLLPAEAWAEAAQQVAPAPADVKTVRRALYTAYGVVLAAACDAPADTVRREQAYGELYDYFWRQAYYRDAEAACDIAQEAIILVFRSFTEPGLARCTDPATFLDFAHAKLRAARTNIWRERRRERKYVSLVEDDAVHDDGDRSIRIVLADTRPSPLEDALRAETQAETLDAIQAEVPPQTSSVARSQKPAAAQTQETDERRARLWAETRAKTEDERRSWSKQAIPKLIAATLRALQELWQTSRLRRQLATVIHTYVDRVSDDEIACRLSTTTDNVQLLRKRGLDKLAERLYGDLTFG